MGSSSGSIKGPTNKSDGNNRVAQQNVSSLEYGKRSSDKPALALLTKRLNEVKGVNITNLKGVKKVITETTVTLKDVIQYARNIYALLTEVQAAVTDLGLKLVAEMNRQLKLLDTMKKQIKASEGNTRKTNNLPIMQALGQIGRSDIDGIYSLTDQIVTDIRPSRAENDNKNKNESILRVEIQLQDLHNQQIELKKLITETQAVLQQCQHVDLSEASINKIQSLLDKFAEVKNHITSLETFKKQLETEERKQQEEERKQQEQEQKRRDEENRKITEENNRIAEEKRRIAEETRKREEERKAMELEKQRKQQEEYQERQRIEEERRLEEERKRQEEEEKRRDEQQHKNDEENRKIAEKNRKIEEEKKRKADEKRKRDEERKAMELEKQRKQQEEDQERQRVADERRKLEEEQKRQNAIKILNLKLSKKEKPDWNNPDTVATLKYERNHDEVDGNNLYHKNIDCFVLTKKDTVVMSDIHCDVEDVKDSDLEGTFRADSSLKTGDQFNSEKIRLTPTLPITEKIHARVFIPHEDVDRAHEASIMGCVDGGKWENQVLVYPKPHDDNEDLNLVGAEISFNKEASFVSVSKRKGMYKLTGRKQ